MVSTSLLIPIGIASAAVSFIGYCIYFDYTRRTHPEFRNRLKEKRRKDRKNKPSDNDAPQFSSVKEMNDYFMEKLNMGCYCAQMQDFDKAVDLFYQGIVHTNSPPDKIELLVKKLLPVESQEDLKNRLNKYYGKSAGPIVTEVTHKDEDLNLD